MQKTKCEQSEREAHHLNVEKERVIDSDLFRGLHKNSYTQHTDII